MKKKINVIDLDKTLIPYDSFRLLAIREILKGNLRIISITVLRIVRLISLKKYKEIAIQNIDKKYDKYFFNEYALKLYQDIDSRVLEKILKETDNNTINVLLSASPDLYVKYLVNKLNWIGSGSYINDEGVFKHLHGKQKIKWVKKNFHFIDYNYNLAISDSSTDDDLLDLFSVKIKWIAS